MVLSEHVLCALAEIDAGTARRFDIGAERIAVVRIDDDVYALGDRCSHADVSLAEGEVDAVSREVECPKHGSTFELATGEPTCLPAVRAVPVYTVTVIDGSVVLTIDEEN